MKNVGSGILLRWLFAAVALACLSVNAHALSGRYDDFAFAQDGPTSGTAVPKKSGGSAARTFSAVPGGARMETSKGMPWTPAKTWESHMAKWKAQATSRNMAKAIANPVGGLITLGGGAAIAWLLHQSCVEVFGGKLTISEGDAWSKCKFVEISTPTYWTNANNETIRTSPQASCQAYASYAYGWAGGVGTYNPSDSFCRVYDSGGGYRNGVITTQYGTTTVEVPDGMEDATNEEVEDKLTAKLDQICMDPVDHTYCSGVLKELVEQGATPVVDVEPLEGPATVPGGEATSTTTNPDGSKIKKTEQKQFNCTYSDNKVTCTVTTTTTTEIFDENGDKTGEETTSDEDEDTRTKCERDKNAVGCDGEFDVPEGEIPRETKELTYEAEDLGLGSGTCPSDVTLVVQGRSFNVFSYSPGCQLLNNYVKPVVLVISTIIAFFILMPGGRPE